MIFVIFYWLFRLSRTLFKVSTIAPLWDFPLNLFIPKNSLRVFLSTFYIFRFSLAAWTFPVAVRFVTELQENENLLSTSPDLQISYIPQISEHTDHHNDDADSNLNWFATQCVLVTDLELFLLVFCWCDKIAER